MTHKINSKCFSWHKDLRSYIAEASDLDCDFSPLSGMGGREGFVMIGERTGKPMNFTFTNADKNIEGEIMGWNFVAAVADNKGLIVEPVNCLIIND